MISIYTDEDVDVLLKPLLIAKGYYVFTTHDEKMLSKSDKEQLEHAVKLQCTFLTHNRVHYEKLYSEFTKDNKEHFGVIVATRRNVYELARRIARLLEFHTPDSIKNRLLYI
ncbi:MAG TPA: hypothetical protein ENG83_03000 [Nitrospirae bacterium]|nr:hypothetical protein BMS3Abin06_01135 [bacterium BMS3Abin06]HDH11161.1 hypothetical protein [Nitrospirota bacterium]HDZ02640.1 hypothetical protein [Nitrospirota bacterium]